MKYPTLEEVEQADIVQLCSWTRFLHSPGESAIRESDEIFSNTMKEQACILKRIMERKEELGGMTPEISKLIGW